MPPLTILIKPTLSSLVGQPAYAAADAAPAKLWLGCASYLEFGQTRLAGSA